MSQATSKEFLIQLENFCSMWRIKLNAEKTWCLNFHINKENDNSPRLWLKGELLRYTKSFKFLGITFDPKLTYREHILDIVKRAKKRLNLLKALRGQLWGASPLTILYSYRSYIRPILEYGAVLFAHTDTYLLKKIQAIETEAIKIAYRLAPWATNTSCYSLVTFPNILHRLKTLARRFLENNKKDELIDPLIEDMKPSTIGKHSAVYKGLIF